MAKAVLITGATGKQGGATIDALLAADADFEILAVTRNVESGSARKLAQKSPKIKLVQGDLDKPDAIFTSAKKVTSTPIWGVFSVQVPMGNGGAEGEERQGKALIDASLANSVKHFVYSSVDRGGEASIDSPTDIPHFISKHNIEHHLFAKTKNGEMTWTVLRPVAFFENQIPGFIGKVFNTAFKIALKGKPLQLIATSDIGFFAAESFLRPEQYKSRAISLAGDELTYDQFLSIFEEKTGQKLPHTFSFICYLIFFFVKEMGNMFRWFHTTGYGANIAELRKIHPGLKNYATWLETESQFSTKR